MFDIIIIGAGPAGLSAGIYATTRNKKVLIIEKTKIGGLIKNVSAVTHYIGAKNGESGQEFSKRLTEQAEKYNLNIIYETVQSVELVGSIKTVKTEKNTYEAKKIIIAGGSSPRKLLIKGEKDVIEKYFSLNASIDGARFSGKSVYVMGGGDAAIKEALYLSDIAAKVTIIHELDDLNCIYEFREKLMRKENMEVLLNTRLLGINGTNQIKSLEFMNLKTDETFTIEDEGAGIFVYVGTEPNSDIYTQLKRSDGYISTNEFMETEIENVYAVGDIRKKEIRQISTAVSDGTIAGVMSAK